MITRNKKKGTKLVLVLLFTLGCPARKDLPPVEPPKTILEEALLRTVIIHYNISDSAKGTGVLLDAQGTVLTCHHVVFGWQDRLRVSQDSKHFFDAHVIREEPAIDLVLLKTDLKMPVAPLRYLDRSELAINDPIFLFGSAWGLGQTFLKGYVAHLDRTGTDIRMPGVPFVQTMGTSFPGCSGAAVYRLDGRFIGINRATVGADPGNSTGLVIPAGFVQAFLEQNTNL